MAGVDQVLAALSRIERRLGAIEQAVLTTAVTDIVNTEVIMSALDTLEADVAAQTDVVASAVTLLSTLHAELTEAIASGDPERVQAVADQLEANTQALADAVAANTPAEPEPAPEG